MELSCPLGTTRRVPQEKFPRKPYNKSFIDQACSAKMAGYWPRSFFACLWTSTPSRSINTQKKNLVNIQPSWPHAWSISHIYYMASSVSGQEESNPALWLVTRAGKMELSCPLGTTRRVPQEIFPWKPYNKSFIDQACSAKMAWYWPRSFFCVFMDRDGVEVHKHAKKELGQYPAILTSRLVNIPYILTRATLKACTSNQAFSFFSCNGHFLMQLNHWKKWESRGELGKLTAYETSPGFYHYSFLGFSVKIYPNFPQLTIFHARCQIASESMKFYQLQLVDEIIKVII